MSTFKHLIRIYIADCSMQLSAWACWLTASLLSLSTVLFLFLQPWVAKTRLMHFFETCLDFAHLLIIMLLIYPGPLRHPLVGSRGAYSDFAVFSIFRSCVKSSCFRSLKSLKPCKMWSKCTEPGKSSTVIPEDFHWTVWKVKKKSLLILNLLSLKISCLISVTSQLFSVVLGFCWCKGYI